MHVQYVRLLETTSLASSFRLIHLGVNIMELFPVIADPSSFIDGCLEE